MKARMDIGYNTTKCTGDNGKKSFLSTIKLRDSDLETGEYIIEFEGKEYIIGEDNGQGSTETDRTKDLVFKLCFLTSIATQMRDKEDMNVTVVTGLPMLQYKDKENRIALQKAFEGKTFEIFLTKGKRRSSKKFKITKMLVFAQSAGLNFIRKDLVERRTIGVDIGGGTVDTSIYKNGKWVDGDTKKIGVNSMYTDLLRRIGKNHNVYYSDRFVAEEIIKFKTIIKNGVEVNVEKEIHESMEKKAKEIIAKVKEMYPEEYDISKKVFMGGGAELLEKYLEAEMQNENFEIIEKPQYTNLIIYDKIGEMKNV